jgi:lipoprotein NlpI
MKRFWPVVFVVAAVLGVTSCAAETPLEQALAAFKKDDFEAARKHAQEAVKADAKSQPAHLLLGLSCLRLRDNQPAVDAFTSLLKLSPQSVEALDRRGDAFLKLGKFKEAVADFDAMLELQPQFKPEHWRRGIALYYAGQFEEGAKQFETHKIANPQDVENAAWHYLCNSRVIGNDKARAQLIDVTQDRRVPMAEIQKLFAGKLKPEDVLARAEKIDEKSEEGKEARFYANLYVALWYESEKNSKKVIEHLTPAVEKYKIGHYMWDVANVHLALLKKK